MGVAGSVGSAMVAAGLACMLHAIFPFWFKTTASRTLEVLVRRVKRVGEEAESHADTAEQAKLSRTA